MQMPLSDRDYMKGKHPPSCTCVDCVNKRLGIVTHRNRHKSKHQEYANSSHVYSTSTSTHNSKKKESCFVRVLSCSIIFVIVVLIVGLVSGAIYGITKYHGNIWNGITDGYHWVANGVVDIKDKVVSWYSSLKSSEQNSFVADTSTLVSSTSTIHSTYTTTPDGTVKKPSGIDKNTGIYKDYYLGLVNSSEGYISGDGCYDDTGDFVILINNKNAKNPTYQELLNFLQLDNTDEYPYNYTNLVPGFYYGTAESHVDLNRIKDIIDGTIQPDPPDICADFAERLHNNAEKAGIRCGYVSLDMSGYTDPLNLGIASNSGHACDAFETTDKGLVFIDCTGTSGNYGPGNNDTIVDIKVGQEYNPQYLFPNGGWYMENGAMGMVANMEIIWDGSWN
jgi:hypothetical protein